MRRQAKVLSNWLGASKEMYAEYINAAGITDAEQNRIRLTYVSPRT